MSTRAPRRLEYMLVRDLAPAKRNPKAHDLDTLRASIERFGYVEPAVLDERTERLVVGHGRTELLADAEAAGLAAPEGVRVSREGWKVPVVRGWASANDEEAEAYVVASNAVGEGLWNRDLLAELLTDVAASDAGLEGTGFDADYLADLTASLAPPPTLDELDDELGDPDPRDFWPVVRAQLPPEVHGRFLELTADAGPEMGDRIAWLVEQVEAQA